MEMGPAHHNPLDAQHFDPLRRTCTRLVLFFKTGSSKLMMEKGLCLRTERVSVWLDHDAVVHPLEGGGSNSEGSCPSTPSSSSSSSSSSISTTDACTTSPTLVDMPPSRTQQFNVYGRDDMVVTCTIIRPNPNSHHNPTCTPSRMRMVLARIFSRSSSPTTTHPPSPSSSSSALPRSTPPSRPTNQVLQALNCFSTSSTFDNNVDGMQVHERKRPVFQVIVVQTRERYEDDMAFKEIVGSVLPAAGVRGRA
ncbi:hypothetical protein EDB19DRAFT_1952898 [Suillus lakei]|nr:hypothetical protein EDB19DRAFT_1952898 [Suillus lakei]